jgi:hypothetical protein
MKKSIVSISLLLIVALAISACSAATSAAPTTTTGAGVSTSPVTTTGAGTPAASQTGSATQSTTGTTPAGGVPTIAATSEATTGATSQGTSAATTASTTAATSAPTIVVTTAATAAATSAATTAATGAATMSTTGTPAAAMTSIPVTGATGTPFAGISGNFVRLSILLQSNLDTGSQSGKITGVVIAQPNLSNGSSTATPAANQSVPYVRYVVVDMSGTASSTPAAGTNGNEMLLPWQMFAFNPVTTSSDGKVSQTFTLKGSAASRASVPQTSLPNTTGVLSQDWDAQLSQYWASQGFSVPVTGNSGQQDTEVLLRQTVNGANIVDPQNQALGQVSDFLIDANTGQFVYAVFNGGSLFGNRYFVIPVRNLIFQLSSASASGLGNIQLNVPSTALNAAPFINNLGQVPLDQNTLQQLNNYWQNLQK